MVDAYKTLTNEVFFCMLYVLRFAGKRTAFIKIIGIIY